MLKIFIFILLLYLHTNFISSNEENRSTNNNEIKKSNSPTYNSNKKTKVIFYMPGSKKNGEENTHETGENIEGKGGISKGVHKGSQSSSNEHSEGESDNHGGYEKHMRDEQKQNKEGDGDKSRRKVYYYQDSSDDEEKRNNSENEEQKKRLEEEYEKLRKEEEERARRINRERKNDMDNSSRHKGNKTGENTTGNGDRYTTYKYIHRLPHSDNSEGEHGQYSGSDNESDSESGRRSGGGSSGESDSESDDGGKRKYTSHFKTYIGGKKKKDTPKKNENEGGNYSVHHGTNGSESNGEDSNGNGDEANYRMHHGTDGGGGYGSNGEGGNRNGDEASYWMHRGADGNGGYGNNGGGNGNGDDASYNVHHGTDRSGGYGSNGEGGNGKEDEANYRMHHGTDGSGGYGSNGEGGNGNGDEASYWMHRGADGNGSNARNDKPGHFPYKRIYDYTTDDSDDEHNEESKNKKKKYKTFSQRNRKNGYEKLDNSDDDEESEYETRKGPHEKDNEDKNGKSKLGSFTRNNENENSYNSDANSKENGSESESERNRKGSETDKDNSEDENNIYERHNNDYAKKRANEIEDELNRGEYSRNNSRDKDQKGKGKGKGNYKTDKDGYNSSDSEDSDDDTVDRYYVDNGQDMLIKEKMYNSHGREGEGGLEDENDANSKYKNEKVSYHFSTYMNFEDKEILSSNEIELNKMIGDDFSREMENYCHLNVPSQKTGSYLDLAFEFSRALEELRNEMLNDLIKSKKMGKTKIFNILHIIQNSTNEKKSSSKNQIYEDEDYADEANSFRDENKNPLSAKYNSIMKQYLCHLFMNNPGKNQLDRLYHHNLALGELIKPIRTKYKKLASSSISFNYELYIASSNNIFLLAHMLLLSLAYLSFNDFFVSGIKSFYSLETLLLAKSDFTFFMYNEMCNVYYKPGKFFKKDITFIPIESRPKRHTTFIGEKKMTCDLLELILNAISLINIQELHNNLTNNNVIGYENSLSFSISAIRIFSKVCPRVNSSNMLKCEFENSTLHKKQIKKTDIREKENQKNLKRAFDLLRIFAEIENNSTKGQPNAAYIKLIMEQNKYTEFYKYLFWYDSRQLIYINKGEKNKKSKNKIKYIYNDFIKRGEKLKKKLIKLDSSYKTKSNALLVFYGIIDRYANFLTKSETIRKLFLNDTSSIRHYLYLNGVHFKTSKSYLESMKKLLEELEETTNSPMKFIVRGNYIEHLNNIARNENLFYINLFILSVLSVKEPVLHYYNEKKKMLAATLSEKFASSTSAFIPHKLRRLVVTLKKGILKKKLLTTLAKIKLLQHIPAYLLENITSSIRFTTHTIATMQIIQNAKLVSKDKLSQQTKNSHFAKQIFTKGGFPSYADKLISKWYSEGFEEYKRKQIENQKMENSIEKELKESSKESINNDSTENEEEQKQIEEQEEKEREKKEDKLFFNENDKWDFYLNKELTRALGLWLDMNSNSPNNAGFVYKLVEDSKFLLENNIEDNIIFSRTLKPTKQTAFRKFFNKIISLGNMLLRKPGFKVEHALWFGAAIDIKKAFILLEKVSELHKLMHDQEGSWLINEAFIEIVDHIVDISTNKHLREPFSVSRNPGMMAINPKYATLPHDERIKEFQNSMCADHCSSVWKIISTFALQHLKNPDSLKTYEEKFSKNAFGNKIDDKDFVHNFKMILGGDAALHYFDNMLSKSMKKELKSMKYGVSLTSAFSLKLTKLVFTQMQLPYLSQMFYVQAPYFGHFIGKWQKERQKSRMKEIMSFMTLGALSAYTMLSAMDITQHAEDIGMGPAASCYTSTYPPPRQICLQSAVKTTLTNSTEAAMKSVFSVGLFASIGPYLFAPMIGLAVWNILKSEFKVLQRIDMALKNVFKNMWKKFLSLKGITKLRNIFKRKNSMKKKIIENAEHKMKEMKENPAKAKAHKMSVETMHKHSKGGYHYVSYARIQI